QSLMAQAAATEGGVSRLTHALRNNSPNGVTRRRRRSNLTVVLDIPGGGAPLSSVCRSIAEFIPSTSARNASTSRESSSCAYVASAVKKVSSDLTTPS